MLQKASKQIESIAGDVATLSTTTQTLSADNEALREQLRSHADALSHDLGEINLRLDRADQANNIATTRLNGMENDIASIYDMAAILPQEMQNIIAQSVSQSVATAFASLQQNTQRSPPRGRILHRKIVPIKTRTLGPAQYESNDSKSGKDRQNDISQRTYPYILDQSQRIAFWTATILFCEVTITVRKRRRTNIYKDFEAERHCIEVDIITQTRTWPLAGRVHANFVFELERGFSVIPQINLTPSRFLFEDNPFIQAIRTGDVERLRVGFASNQLCPLDIVVDVPRRQGLKSDLGLIEASFSIFSLKPSIDRR